MSANGMLYIRLNQVKQLIENYTYPTSLTLYLKAYFSKNKKLGGRDRKQIKHWFYLYFKSDYIQSNIDDELMQLLVSDNSGILDKLKIEPVSNNDEKEVQWCFPLAEKLSKNLGTNQKQSLKNEKLFWVRNAKETAMAVVNYKSLIFGFEQGLNIAEYKHTQIQDLASFQSVELVSDFIDKPNLKVWDACAGAGGKSIALKSIAKYPFELYTSDVRASITLQMEKRFNNAGISNYHHAIVDLIEPIEKLNFGKVQIAHQGFDIIILDAPCSGSGTWGRNPQHLRYFNESRLANFTYLQENIFANALPMLKEGGTIIYITCSAYEDENEDMISKFQKKHGVVVKSQKYLGESNTDVLFFCCMQKKN